MRLAWETEYRHSKKNFVRALAFALVEILLRKLRKFARERGLKLCPCSHVWWCFPCIPRRFSVTVFVVFLVFLVFWCFCWCWIVFLCFCCVLKLFWVFEFVLFVRVPMLCGVVISLPCSTPPRRRVFGLGVVNWCVLGVSLFFVCQLVLELFHVLEMFPVFSCDLSCFQVLGGGPTVVVWVSCVSFCVGCFFSGPGRLSVCLGAVESWFRLFPGPPVGLGRSAPCSWLFSHLSDFFRTSAVFGPAGGYFHFFRLALSRVR